MDFIKLFEFFQLIEKLKNVMRYSTNKPYQESTAEHSWKLILMAYVTAEEMKLEMDILHALKIAMVHDIPEIITGDIDNTLIFDGMYDLSDKIESEENAMKEIIKGLSPDLGEELTSLWKEYEQGKTIESRFVKAMDKFEALSHMLSKEMTNTRLDHAVQYADNAVINFQELKPLLRIFKEKLKEQFKLANLEWKEEYDLVLNN